MCVFLCTIFFAFASFILLGFAYISMTNGLTLMNIIWVSFSISIFTTSCGIFCYDLCSCDKRRSKESQATFQNDSELESQVLSLTNIC